MFTLLSASGGTLSNIWSTLTDFCVKYGLKLIGAILVLLIGIWIVKLILKLMKRSRWFNRIDKNVQSFALSAARALLYTIVVVSVIAIIGVPMASIVAVIGSCGVAIGLALQGSLSNLAGGLMLILFKPFRVGDYIVTDKYEGAVEEIGIFHTTLATLDNRRVVLPNANLSNSSLVNNTHYDTRRCDLAFNTALVEDREKVVSVLKAVAEAHEDRLTDREIEARFDSFAEGAAKYHLRVWCNTSDYWGLYYALQSECKDALEKNGIKVALPQIEVHEAKE